MNHQRFWRRPCRIESEIDRATPTRPVAICLSFSDKRWPPDNGRLVLIGIPTGLVANARRWLTGAWVATYVPAKHRFVLPEIVRASPSIGGARLHDDETAKFERPRWLSLGSTIFHPNGNTFSHRFLDLRWKDKSARNTRQKRTRSRIPSHDMATYSRGLVGPS